MAMIHGMKTKAQWRYLFVIPHEKLP